MFDPSRTFCNFHPLILELTMKPGARLNKTRFNLIVTTVQKYPEEKIICCAILGTKLVWQDEAIRTISNGKQWCLLRDYLRFMNVLQEPDSDKVRL